MKRQAKIPSTRERKRKLPTTMPAMAPDDNPVDMDGGGVLDVAALARLVGTEEDMDVVSERVEDDGWGFCGSASAPMSHMSME